MKTLVRLFLIAPVALVIVLFAVANRKTVTVSLDPFPGNDIAGPEITAPLFIALFLAGLVGVLAGGAAVWLTQGRYRKAAREAHASAQRARVEAETVRAAAPPASLAALPGLPARRDAA